MAERIGRTQQVEVIADFNLKKSVRACSVRDRAQETRPRVGKRQRASQAIGHLREQEVVGVHECVGVAFAVADSDEQAVGVEPEQALVARVAEHHVGAAVHELKRIICRGLQHPVGAGLVELNLQALWRHDDRFVGHHQHRAPVEVVRPVVAQPRVHGAAGLQAGRVVAPEEQGHGSAQIQIRRLKQHEFACEHVHRVACVGGVGILARRGNQIRLNHDVHEAHAVSKIRRKGPVKIDSVDTVLLRNENIHARHTGDWRVINDGRHAGIVLKIDRVKAVAELRHVGNDVVSDDVSRSAADDGRPAIVRGCRARPEDE